MKKLLSTVLCLCMILSILPSNVFAANITIFNVTVNEPQIGEVLSYEASVPETASTYVSKVEWNGKLDPFGKVMLGHYEVRVTVRIKDGLDDKYIKVPTKDTVKVNGNSAKLTEVSADKKQAVVVYTFFVDGGHKDVNGQEVVNTESNISNVVPKMLGSIESAVISAVTARAEPDAPFAKAPEEIRDVISFSLEEPTSGQKHNGKVTTFHPDIEITSITWAGQVDKNGVYIVGNHYDVIVAFKIKGNVNKVLPSLSKYREAKINNIKTVYETSQVSNRAGYIRYTFEVQPPKPVVDIKNVFTQAQADERWVTVNPMYPTEIIVNEGETLKSLTLNNSFDQNYCVKKIVIARSYGKDDPLAGDAVLIDSFPNIEELWLSSGVDVKKFIDEYAHSRFGLTGDKWMMAIDSTNIDTQKFTIFVSDSKVSGFGEEYGMKFNHELFRRCNTRLYSGDVMEAYKKGASASYEWCTNHVYESDIYTPDRVHIMKSCKEPISFYYSCTKCGKCEYNPNHTVLVNPNYTFHWDRSPSVHWCVDRNLSDKYYIGTNSRGERVYWKSCVMCGVIYNDDLPPSEGMILPEHALEGSYLKDDAVGAFAVRADRYVNAKMSSWAQNDVQWASQNGILDLNILGNDYTKPITRLQFASVAVKLAETLIGRAITPATQGTFADTDNEYVLKAYAAGITSGVSATEFNPGGNLTRQQMATFIHRALMYVRDNTNIRYTTYTPALEKYTDSWAVQSWAEIPMGFMNALGLVKGVSDTEISPDGTCTIEQAVVVANRSVNADQIGWYQIPISSEQRFLGFASDYFENCYYYAPTSHAPTQTLVFHSDRIWVDIPSSGGQKLSENPDMILNMKSRMLATVDPYTGDRAWVPEILYRPIKELKDTDVAEYNQYYDN